MADVREKSKAAVETSEAQIAVHWREKNISIPRRNLSGKRICLIPR